MFKYVIAFSMFLSASCSPIPEVHWSGLNKGCNDQGLEDLGVTHLALAPRTLVAGVSKLVVGHDYDLYVVGTGVGLGADPAAAWSFGACTIESYAYSSIDDTNGQLSLTLGAAVPAICDLILTVGGKAVASQYNSFQIVP